MTLDYFQGFLSQAGVPSTALPRDGRTLSPQQALELVPHLLSTPVTLGNFGLRRMAAHLLLEVATGDKVVTRDELHACMRRFSRLLVLRPDGYLVRATSGVAVQKAGQVVLAEDGTLRAGRFAVGPFYAVEGERLFPVNQQLEVPKGARPAGLYEPDDNPALALAEGSVLAVVDMVEGLYRLVFYTDETLEGLLQLPGAVRQLYEKLSAAVGRVPPQALCGEGTDDLAAGDGDCPDGGHRGGGGCEGRVLGRKGREYERAAPVAFE
ncbi:hypothetical protein ACN28I_42640 [Archangium gephyra]|uniref:hypothetical protein n=1 Tax=Archangium gephyra TaxID=48 RepID=UPI003B7E86B9